MPGVARDGDQTSTSHGCDSITTVTGASGNVFANGIGIERQGDPTVVHRFGGRNCSSTHTATIDAGSGNVFVNGLPIARIGDSTDGGAIISGSSTVIAN